ncbi:hypothetical protein MW7_010615 [Imbroritus primus]|uniref:Uncharacterized protein n=1 Tax=Imbroritus primus TaxID=3058603 RepID=A0ACD3SNZ2_9BURK|nr:hypothetical protein MW7_010615 [Burkholderiaceae bacterium PBA]
MTAQFSILGAPAVHGPVASPARDMATRATHQETLVMLLPDLLPALPPSPCSHAAHAAHHAFAGADGV